MASLRPLFGLLGSTCVSGSKLVTRPVLAGPSQACRSAFHTSAAVEKNAPKKSRGPPKKKKGAGGKRTPKGTQPAWRQAAMDRGDTKLAKMPEAERRNLMSKSRAAQPRSSAPSGDRGGRPNSSSRPWEGRGGAVSSSRNANPKKLIRRDREGLGLLPYRPRPGQRLQFPRETDEEPIAYGLRSNRPKRAEMRFPPEAGEEPRHHSAFRIRFPAGREESTAPAERDPRKEQDLKRLRPPTSGRARDDFVDGFSRRHDGGMPGFERRREGFIGDRRRSGAPWAPPRDRPGPGGGRSFHRGGQEPDEFVDRPTIRAEPPPTVGRNEVAPIARPFSAYSPPLSPGLLESITELLGTKPPTPIQSLSLDYFFASRGPNKRNRTKGSSETLLAAETGSGKTIAYLLPVLQNLKETELKAKESAAEDESHEQKMNSPRALILAPTHELCRQIAKVVKKLTHIDKLRTVCFSNPIPRHRPKDIFDINASPEEFEEHTDGMGTRPADIVVGTPAKMLEMFRLRDSVEEELNEKGDVVIKKDFGESRGLEKVEWVVVDEADVLFGKDFCPATRALLHFVREARQKALGLTVDESKAQERQIEQENASIIESQSVTNNSEDSAEDVQKVTKSDGPDPTKAFTAPPFNLLLSTATVSSGLGMHLATFHPQMIQLLSPNLHRLPRTLRTEHVAWTSGNRSADVADKILSIWAEETRRHRLATGDKEARPERGKILIFCNTSEHAEKLGRDLAERKVRSYVLTSNSDARRRGSNNHLSGFLNLEGEEAKASPSRKPENKSEEGEEGEEGEKAEPIPNVLITTSLLSRGLDFSPQVKHVLIMDQPQNMVDFVHRAGRTGRAGEQGKVVIFTKSDRKVESPYIQQMRSRVNALSV